MKRPEDTGPGAGAVLPPGLVLFVAVAAFSWAGPLVRFTDASALAVSAWRLLFSVAFIALVLAARRGGIAGALRRARLDRGEWALAVASGLLLAAHFWSWIASLDHTTIASSVVLVSTQPFFVAVLSVLFLGERPVRREWLGIAIAVAGAGAIGWGDLALGPGALFGDFLALAAALLAAGYYIIGRRLRRKLDLWTYVGVVYGVAAAVLSVAILLTPAVSLTGYARADWLVFLALAAGPMMLGHTGVNYALRYIPAYIANLAVLGEPVGAILLAWLLPAIREVPPLQTLVGGALILLGIAIGSLPGRGGRRSPPPPD
jgi:drug/metabolite transporter (DMT)-like permease